MAINFRVVLFSLAVSLLAGALFGAAPAIKAARLTLNDALKQGGRGVTRRRYRAQHFLLAGEIGLTLMILIGAGLMVRTLQNLWTVNPGFDPEGVLVFYTGISPQRASSPEKIRAVMAEMNERLASMPGVDAATVEIGGLPLIGNTTVGFATELDSESTVKREARMANYYAIGTEYFRTMRIPLIHGRAFTLQDTLESPRVVIVDEDLARSAFGDEDPLGKQIRADILGGLAQIVGVAGHVKHTGLDKDETARIRSQLYAPITQLPDDLLPLATKLTTGIVRSTLPRPILVPSLRKELAAIDNGSAVAGEQSMMDAIAVSLATRRFLLIVLGVFAVMALVLSGVGVYGVVSYFVGQRTNEIGIRISIGAEPRHIIADVLSEGGKLGVAGAVIGLVGAAGLSRLATGLLFGIASTDFLTYSIAALFLFLLTLAACWIPARRAVRIDPVAALRAD